MSLVFNEKYPGKTAGATNNYPYGEARNVSGPGNGDGTPWDAALVNDIFGLLQGLLIRANIVPNGQSDTALNSQYLQALLALFMPKQTPISAVLEDNGYISIPFPFGNSESVLTLNWGVWENGYYPGEVQVDISFKKRFSHRCFAVVANRKMSEHGPDGDCGISPFAVTKYGCSFSLQVFNSSSVGRSRGFYWFAIGV